MADTDTCRHGGPGDLVAEEKKLFVVTYAANLEKVHRALLLRCSVPELIAAELVLLEELMKNSDALRAMVDSSSMKMYFASATNHLLCARVEEARIHARAGVYIAMLLRHGDAFWEMTNESHEVQKQTLLDMHIALVQIGIDQGLARLLNSQTNATAWNVLCLR
uniref:Uncharacterized protein n=1 Tax=Odontella aurita TaxID=265563 RepID=A0A7S4JWC7_9STRA|mmetsp:Transcript_5564/g.16153  ORF Transcript_5564/g.16153 Transcript_5564/m.16153 type:complete len:164 (+) Transcript_5564:69-560(+)